MNRLAGIGQAGVRLLNDLTRDTRAFLAAVWRWYRSLRGRSQVGIAIALIILIVALFAVLRHQGPVEGQSSVRAVTLRSVAEIAGAGAGGTVLGSVRSLQEAEVLAKTSGTVQGVNARLGQAVPANYVIASLENARERAAVLQAEGAYDAAVAARSATSVGEENTQARNAYQEAYTDLDTTIETNIDQFFGTPGYAGPRLLITADGSVSEDLSRRRTALSQSMRMWQNQLDTASSRDPKALLDEAEDVARETSDLLAILANAANRRDSGVTAAQSAALASARATVDSVLASISSARASFRSGEVGATASVDAAVKSALGSLRAAQANLEQTVVRAPIAGTINYLPIRTGDYVTALTHVSTVAQNNALEVITYVSEGDRPAIAVGSEVFVEETYAGVITAIAPALDPVTKQIEVRISVDASSGLVNGESVSVSLPGIVTDTIDTTGPILLPLASVKLRASDRVVFTVSEEGRLVATPVETGTVRGGKIEILSPLAADLQIVTDARGLAEGERVSVVGAP